MTELSPNARREYYVHLGNSLPAPVNPTREHHERRVTTAIETFNALRPGNADEARLAVKIVLCSAHAVEKLREANVHREDFAKQTRCYAQAASMMREERAAKRELRQEQKMRLAIEGVGSRVAAATPSAPAPQANPRAVPPVQAAAPSSAPVAAPVPAADPPRRPAAAANPAPRPAAAQAAPPPSSEAIAKAEAFVEENIAAAAQIRHDRGVTPQNKAYFRHLTLPTDLELIDALVRGTSPTLTMLDDVGGEDMENAA